MKFHFLLLFYLPLKQMLLLEADSGCSCFSVLVLCHVVFPGFVVSGFGFPERIVREEQNLTLILIS